MSAPAVSRGEPPTAISCPKRQNPIGIIVTFALAGRSRSRGRPSPAPPAMLDDDTKRLLDDVGGVAIALPPEHGETFVARNRMDNWEITVQ